MTDIYCGMSLMVVLAAACFANGFMRGAEFVLAFAGAAAIGLLLSKRALTTMGGAGTLALIVGITLGAEADLTLGVLLAGVGAMGLLFMPWRLRNPWA